MAKLRLTGTNKRLATQMLVAGLAIGIIFPLVAQFFVEAKSASLWLVFWIMCVAAGIALGLACLYVAEAASEARFNEVAATARSKFGNVVPLQDQKADANSQVVAILDGLQQVMQRFDRVNTDMRALTSEILSATEEQASGAAQQAAAVTETSATVEELAQTSKQIADNSGAVVAVAERTLASAEEGMRAVEETKLGIDEIRVSTQQSSDRILALGERSQEIGRVLTIIDDIAEQTKILALNAAIEAARAGEAGKGFAVVAEEIRKLADSVTESTQEIGRVVREIQASTSQLIMSTERAAKKVDEGGSLAGRTSDSLDKIVAQVEETTDAAKQISIATQQQRTASDQVVLSMKEVAQVSQQAAETSRQIAAAIMDLNTLTDSLLSR